MGTVRKKFVKVKHNVLPETFGCSAAYFDAHIKGRPLEVQYETPTYTGVKDGNGEEWTIARANVMDPSAHNTVGQEMTFNRGVE